MAKSVGEYKFRSFIMLMQSPLFSALHFHVYQWSVGINAAVERLHMVAYEHVLTSRHVGAKG